MKKWIPQFGPGYDPRGVIVKIEEVIEHIDSDHCLTKSLVLSCGHKSQVNPIYQYQVGERSHCLKCLDILRQNSTIEVDETVGMR